jgi:hypothetical protein
VGSHKLPYKTLDDTKDIILVAGSQGAIEAHKKDMWDQVKAKGLKKLAFAPKKGQALIWHAKLIHGGKCLLWRCRKHGNGKGVLDGKKPVTARGRFVLFLRWICSVSSSQNEIKDSINYFSTDGRKERKPNKNKYTKI